MFCRLESLDENSYNISANVKSALHVLHSIYLYKGYRTDLEILLRTLKQVCELLYKLLLLSGYLDPG